MVQEVSLRYFSMGKERGFDRLDSMRQKYTTDGRAGEATE
jgi:hypothetical protein